MDTPVTSQEPAGPAPVAPSPAAPSPLDVQAQIDALMRTPEYQRSDRAAVDLVQQWYQFKEHGQVREPEVSSAHPAELTTPPGFDVPDMLRTDASQTIRELGLGAQAQPVYEFFLGRSGPPSVPSAYRPPTPEEALGKLRESEGPYADHVLDQARAAVSVLEQLRSRAGRPAGELRAFLDATGAGSDPRVIKFFSRLGGRFNQTDPDLMKAAARPRTRR